MAYALAKEVTKSPAFCGVERWCLFQDDTAAKYDIVSSRMSPALALPKSNAVSPALELGAYEALWAAPDATQKRVADRFRSEPGAPPSAFVAHDVANRMFERVRSYHAERGVTRFGIRVHRCGDYPDRLRDARHPVELLQYRGIWELTEMPAVAVVGTRAPSKEGMRRARKLTSLLGRADFTIVSGLARGIDTVAHTTALKLGIPTYAVVGTPVSDVYPKENRDLQGTLASSALVVSQVPVIRYASQDWRINRTFFPARNATMSALSEATVIVEAGETSGTLTQARAALYQKRKLFILDSCFRRKDLTWPERFQKLGAVRVTDFDEILDALKAPSQAELGYDDG